MYIYQGTYIYIYLGSLRGHIYTSEMVAKDWTRDTTADREAPIPLLYLHTSAVGRV